MGLEYKDYYKVLGVDRAASAEDVRKAFRKLAAFEQAERVPRTDPNLRTTEPAATVGGQP